MSANYYEKIPLIELKRRYSKDELVSGLIKNHRELQFSYGVLKSELDEALDKLERFELVFNDKENKIIRRPSYNKLMREFSSLKKSYNALKTTNDTLMIKLCKLQTIEDR